MEHLEAKKVVFYIRVAASDTTHSATQRKKHKKRSKFKKKVKKRKEMVTEVTKKMKRKRSSNTKGATTLPIKEHRLNGRRPTTID